MKPQAAALGPSRYARTARALYNAALTDWLASTYHHTSCALCAIPDALLGPSAGPSAGASAETPARPCSLRCFIGGRLLLYDVLSHGHDTRGWQRAAVRRQVWRLVDADGYDDPPAEHWSPLPDDEHAWALDTETQRRLDEWTPGQGGY